MFRNQLMKDSRTDLNSRIPYHTFYQQLTTKRKLSKSPVKVSTRYELSEDNTQKLWDEFQSHLTDNKSKQSPPSHSYSHLRVASGNKRKFPRESNSILQKEKKNISFDIQNHPPNVDNIPSRYLIPNESFSNDNDEQDGEFHYKNRLSYSKEKKSKYARKSMLNFNIDRSQDKTTTHKKTISSRRLFQTPKIQYNQKYREYDLVDQIDIPTYRSPLYQNRKHLARASSLTYVNHDNNSNVTKSKSSNKSSIKKRQNSMFNFNPRNNYLSKKQKNKSFRYLHQRNNSIDNFQKLNISDNLDIDVYRSLTPRSRKYKLQNKIEQILRDCQVMIGKGAEIEALKILPKTSRLLQCYFPPTNALSLKNAHLTASSFFNTKSYERCQTLLLKVLKSLEISPLHGDLKSNNVRQKLVYQIIFKMLLGRLYQKKNLFNKAAKLLEYAVKGCEEIEKQKLKKQATNKFIPTEDLIQSRASLANCYLNLQRPQDAIVQLEKAKRGFNSLIVFENYRQAFNIITQLANTYLVLGQESKAIQNFSQARQFIKTHSIRNIQYKVHARILTNLSSLYQKQRDFGCSSQVLQQLIFLQSNTDQVDDRERFRTYNQLAKVLSQSTQFSYAIACYKKAIEYSLSQDEAFTIKCKIAKCFQAIGNNQAAVQMFQECLSIYRDDQFNNSIRRLSSKVEEVEQIQLSLVSIYLEEGKQFQARILMTQIQQKANKELDAHSFAILNQVGNVLRREGKHYEALDFYKKSLLIGKQCYQGNSKIGLSIGKILLNIGAIYFLLRRYDEALKYYLHALELHQKILGPCHIQVGRIHMNVGKLYQREQNRVAANKHYQMADHILMQPKSGRTSNRSSISSTNINQSWCF